MTHLDFCQQHPFDLAVTSSTRVIAYDSVTNQVKRTFARFKDKAYSGCFRSDGKLLVAGAEDGIVQVSNAAGSYRISVDRYALYFSGSQFPGTFCRGLQRAAGEKAM